MGIYCYLVNIYTGQNRLRVIVIAELSRIWLDLAEFGRIWWNLVEYGGERQIAVDCRGLRQSRGRSLVAKLVEIGRRI